MQEVLAYLPDLQDSQLETTILRYCLALPKVSCVLRSTLPCHIREAAAAFDIAMWDAVSDLSGGPLPDSSWVKATLPSSLPSSLGGLGIRQASLHAPAAFIGSFDQSSPLVSRIIGSAPIPSSRLVPALADLDVAAKREDWSSIEEVDVPLCQHHLSKAIDQAVFSDLCSDARSKALALSTAIPHAGDWLNVVPCRALGLSRNIWSGAIFCPPGLIIA